MIYYRTDAALVLRPPSLNLFIYIHLKITLWTLSGKSKGTYGQTRGLNNLEMKHVGKLAIIGALLKAVKTSCVRTMQGRTYLIKHRVSSWPLLHTSYKIARLVGLQSNMVW